MKQWAVAVFVAFILPRAWAASDSPLPPLHKPAQVRLFVNAGTAGRPEIRQAADLLQSTLCLPVSVQRVEYDPALYFNPERRQIDSDPVLSDTQARFSDTPAVNILFLDEDLYSAGVPWRYVFASSIFAMESGQGWSVISLARTANILRPTEAERGADWLYKLSLRIVVRAAGFDGQKGCLLDFPNSPEALDRLPRTFCPDHERALVEAGIIGCLGV